ncbi:Thiosulfate sulfurtransferase 18 [Apostasia shenzhenica]|uniref:Thiosulfate sulfurtransferase 18 n=1 Tax=Apostasia shenzhenica TaxID=1088818 RepID=A0A2I0A690_9ASPA|nr:Thiosulfate sulfurtransferase 18 [Apostasia shenzhenica]
MDPNPRPSGGSGDPAVTVDVRECKNLLSSGHRYLDVRTLEEFRNGHPDNALNVPYMFFTPEGKISIPCSFSSFDIPLDAQNFQHEIWI